jgi:hypothetical protein
MIRSKNVDPDAQFAQHPVPLSIRAGASETDLAHGAFVPAWAGKIELAQLYASQLTDADDGVTVDIKKNGVSLLSAAVDPVAAGTTTTLTLTDDDFAAGDEIVAHATTDAGDLLVGVIILHVRPLLGSAERALLGPAG